jgi:3-hydroxyisobutyrate dehydrogenase-like beta-hydroxyacid dehydrogenase
MTAEPGTTVSLIGVGEVGAGLARAFVDHGISVLAYDIRPEAAEKRLTEAGLVEQVRMTDLQTVAAGDLVISAVVPAAAEGLAAELKGLGVSGGALLDINSAGPDQKRSIAELVDGLFTTFTDGTIGGGGFRLAPGPVFHLAGPGASRWSELLRSVEFRTDILGEEPGDIGKAALFKMLRTVFTKGYEALIVESLSVAWRAGLLDSILQSVSDTFDHLSFHDQARLLVAGHVQHAARRVVEAGMAKKAAEQVLPDTPLYMATAMENRYELSNERAGDRYGKPEPADLVAALDILAAH